MKKYNINKEFGIFRYFYPPYNKLVLYLAGIVMPLLPKGIKSNKSLKITKKKINNFDNSNLKIYLYEPQEFKTDKMLLYIHGGAFSFKSYFKHFQMCKRYSLEGKCKVVLVEYRTLPKYKYPTQSKDNYQAYKWIVANSDNLDIDPNKIMLGGDSAGGCLSVDVLRYILEDRFVTPDRLMLIFPALDKRMIAPSIKEFTDTPVWNSKMSKKMWKYYLEDKEYISPNEIESFEGFPKFYIETVEFDSLRDEAIEFTQKLKNNNIEVSFNYVKGAMHGFDIKDCPTTREALKKRIDFLKD